MSTYVSAELRRQVATRADGLCEYGLIHERDTILGCTVDHIVSEKHSGPTAAENLAFACAPCNRAKGSDVGSLVAGCNAFVRFFNPRADRWSEHFQLDGVHIKPLTPIGVATTQILGMNRSERIEERRALIAAGKYPCPEAASRITREEPT